MDPQASTEYVEEYNYYSQERVSRFIYRRRNNCYSQGWVSPFIYCRRKVGWDLCTILGLKRGNKEGMREQHARNDYVFFDALVGLIFTIDRGMEKASWIAYGMFLESIMLAAQRPGLGTCRNLRSLSFTK